MKALKNILSPEGQEIYDALENHCKKLGIMEIDELELTALANAFATYFDAAKYCNENGYKMTFVNAETGREYYQVCPEYTVMKAEYANILKHSAKFGLNPADRRKIFGDLGKKEEKKGFGNLKVARG